jgi:hypothetical protein
MGPCKQPHEMQHLEPRVGYSKWGAYGDGESTTFTGEVVVTYPESERFVAEVGEKPEFPAPPGGWPSDWPRP